MNIVVSLMAAGTKRYFSAEEYHRIQKESNLKYRSLVEENKDMDKEYMTGFRGIDYQRTKSVAEGDSCCDYRLRDAREKSPR